MFIPTLKIMFGPCLPAPPAGMDFPTSPPAMFHKAYVLDRLADLHQSEGRTAHADRLAHATLELRARATESARDRH